MLVAEKTVGLSWVSVRDRLPFDGHMMLRAESGPSLTEVTNHSRELHDCVSRNQATSQKKVDIIAL